MCLWKRTRGEDVIVVRAKSERILWLWDPKNSILCRTFKSFAKLTTLLVMKNHCESLNRRERAR